MLAQHLELSQTTVSLVLNNSPSARSIPQETRNRVVEAARKLNYRPNYFARSLRRSRSMSVGVPGRQNEPARRRDFRPISGFYALDFAGL